MATLVALLYPAHQLVTLIGETISISYSNSPINRRHQWSG